MERLDSLFIQLIRLALGTEEASNVTISESDWTELFRKAEEQTVSGFVFEGIQRLPKEEWPHKTVVYQWASAYQQNARAYSIHKDVAERIHNSLLSEGIPHSFMKGLVCASRYVSPESRNCGDIDFVVSKQDFSRTLAVLDSLGAVDHSLVHEHHGMAWVDGVQVEPHYKVHNYQNPRNDRSMCTLFDEIFPKSLTESDGLPSFPIEFEGMYLVSHMVNHLFEEGLGMRQVIDFSFWLARISEDFNVSQHARYLESMRMTRAHRVFVCLCEEFLGIKSKLFDYDYSNKEKRIATRVMNDIMKVGNFGRASYEFKYDTLFDVMRNYSWVCARSVKLGNICPSEAHMWPISKFCRYICKKMMPSAYSA